MCLGEVGQVVSVDAGTAVVRTAQRESRVSLMTVEAPVAVGDWLVVHSGFALARLEPADAEQALRLRADPASETFPPSVRTAWEETP